MDKGKCWTYYKGSNHTKYVQPWKSQYLPLPFFKGLKYEFDLVFEIPVGYPGRWVSKYFLPFLWGYPLALPNWIQIFATILWYCNLLTWHLRLQLRIQTFASQSWKVRHLTFTATTSSEPEILPVYFWNVQLFISYSNFPRKNCKNVSRGCNLLDYSLPTPVAKEWYPRIGPFYNFQVLVKTLFLSSTFRYCTRIGIRGTCMQTGLDGRLFSDFKKIDD
jgi:hypothetical protein